MGKWQSEQPMHEDVEVDGRIQLPNELKLPFRRQPAPGTNQCVTLALRSPPSLILICDRTAFV
jgi:hypothetical protein